MNDVATHEPTKMDVGQRMQRLVDERLKLKRRRRDLGTDEVNLKNERATVDTAIQENGRKMKKIIADLDLGD